MKTETPAAEANASTFPDPEDAPDADLPTEEAWDSVNPEAVGPEVPPGAEELITWDEVPAEPEAASGSLVEDEADDPAHLVQEGLEEADRELRLEAADQSEIEGEDEDLSDDAEAAEDYPRRGILS